VETVTTRLEEIEARLAACMEWARETPDWPNWEQCDADNFRYLLDEVAWLRGMIQYAIDGPDKDLPEQLGGRAVAGCKKILGDALRGEGRAPVPDRFTAAVERIGPGWPWPIPGIWIIASASTQAEVDRIVPVLLQIPAAKRGLSLEPLLEKVDLFPWVTTNFRCQHGNLAPEPDSYCQPCGCYPDRALLDWIVVGPESGPNRRPMDTDWARSLKDQCVAGGVAFGRKQLHPVDGGVILPPGLDGQRWEQLP